MKKSWMSRLLMGLSFTSVLFVFQACYGTPQDFGADILIEGIVKAKNGGEPLPGIKVSLGSADQKSQYTYTDKSGRFGMYAMTNDSIHVSFRDTIGAFTPKDTVLVNKGESLMVTVELESIN